MYAGAGFADLSATAANYTAIPQATNGRRSMATGIYTPRNAAVYHQLSRICGSILRHSGRTALRYRLQENSRRAAYVQQNMRNAIREALWATAGTAGNLRQRGPARRRAKSMVSSSASGIIGRAVCLWP